QTIPIMLLMMMTQFALLAFLVYTSLAGQNKAEAENLAKLQTEIAEMRKAAEEQKPLAAQEDLLARVFAEMKETEPDIGKRVVEQAKTEKAMKAAVTGLEEALTIAKTKNRVQENDLKRFEERLAETKESLKKESDEHKLLKDQVAEKEKTGSLSWKQ